MNKKILGVFLFAVFTMSSVWAQGRKGLRINEVLVTNETNYQDDYGCQSAWIEIFNTTFGTVDIRSCYLTNDRNNPKKYSIPKGDVLTEMPPRQHLLFWADDMPNRGTFHVNFKLDPDKDNWIGLYDANGKDLIDSVTVPAGIPADYTVIETPVKHVICMTSLQLSNFIRLDACDYVVGITSTRHLFNKEMNGRLKAGKTSKIGIEGNFDNEVIMSINPDVIFISPFKRGGYDAMRETGIPLVPHLGYKEMTPLGQAEWIKFIGMFIGREAEANARFAGIEKRYNELKELAAGVKKRPVVFSGEMRGGNWYAVGGKSFLAELFRDAGADYFLKDDPRSGGVTLDFETVYSRAESADYWRIVNSYDGTFSYDALKSLDPRYADFRAFREKGVIYCNMREKPFYESMPMQPEVVLEDLIHAFHPDLLPDYKPTYYERLN